MEDRNGNAVVISFGTNGKINAITDTVGRTYTINYNTTNGYIDNIVCPEDRIISYKYDASNRLTEVKDAMNNLMKYSYDTWGFMTEIKDHYGKQITKITYNHNEGENQHKVSQAIDALGDVVNYSYDTTNKKTTITDMNNRVYTYWYDSSMYTTRVQDPDAKSTYTEYFLTGGKNKYGDVKSVIDRNGNKTEYEIDDRGNVIKTINPDGSCKIYSYDDKNNLILEKDELGNQTFYIYDTNKKLLLKKAQPLNGTDVYSQGCDETKFAVTQYAYYTAAEAKAQFNCNAGGLLKSISDPEGNITSYTYDADGNIKTETDPESKVTAYLYNRIGQKTRETTPKGYNTDYVYDKNGLLEKTILDDGETTRIIYDANGRKVQEIWPGQYDPAKDDMANHKYNDAGAGFRYTYYDSGMVKTITDPLNNTTSFTYDVYGNKITETKPNGAVYRYEYDNMDRLTKVFFKDSAVSFEFILYEYSYAVLSDGKTQNTEIEHINDGLKASAVYIYDYADRLAERQNPDGTKETSTYKPNGLLETSTNVDGSITYFKYDALNRLTEQWTPFETSSQGILYTYTKIEYDKAGYKKAEKAGKGKVALFEMPSGFVTTSYAYYRNGLLKSAADSAGRRTEYQYDDDGNMSREDVYVSAENMKTKEYSYNHLNKAVEQKLHVSAKDIFGNSFDSTDEKILLTSYSYDKNGNLKTVTDPRMVTTSYTYDHLNRLLSESKPGTDENGAPVTIMTSMTYDWEGKPLTTKDANDNTAFYEYDKRGFLTKVTNAEGGITLYAYDRAGRKLSEVSPKNYDSAKTMDEMNRIEYVYDIMGRILQKIDIYKDAGSGSWIRINAKNLEYDNRGNVIKESDALGYEQDYGTEYTYNLAGKPVTFIDPVTRQRGLPFTIKYEYDSLGRKISETNAKGVETLYSYDDAGNLLTVKVKKNSYSEEKALRTNTYDLTGRLLAETDGNGHTTTYEYNALDKIRKAITPGDSTIEPNILIYQYDENANTRLKKNSIGRIEEYSYDGQNRVISYTSKKADGTQAITTSAKYDRNGNKRFETDGNGVTRENMFDSLNRLIETKTTVNGIEKSTSYAYDANGNQTEMTDWLGNVYTNIYDPLNRLIEKQDPYTTIQMLEYNKNNLQSKSYDALGNMTQFSYDRNGRLIYTIDAEDHVTTQSYDDLGNIEAETDGRGISIVYEYDEFNNMTAVTNAKGERTEYAYDLNGNILTQKDAKGNTTTYEYNAANKAIRRIDHGGRTGQAGRYVYINDKVESFTYYPDGNMKAKKDRKGQITNYTYDIHGRLTEESIGSESVSYTYDGNSNELTMTDGTGTTKRTYDEENRVLTKTVPHMGILTYQYDITEAEGCHAEISTDPKGNETTKVYDKAGRLIKVISNAEETIFTYYGNGSRKSVEYPEGAKEEYTYYKDNLVKTLVNKKADGTIIDSYSYKYDAAHNQIEKQDQKGITNYDYDSLNRLEKVTEPDGKITEYIFDKAGNRIQETITQGSETIATTYEYNEQNRLINTITRNGAVTETAKYEYDPNGNTMTKVVETTKPVDPNLTGSFDFNKAGQSTDKNITYYEYDSWNQLIKTIEGDKTIIAAYNGYGQRIEKTINGITQRYLYEYDKVVLETDGQGNETARNIYGTNLLVREAENETAYYMYNGHGDVTALLNDQGNIIGSYYYDAFGNITEETGEADNPYRYAGYRYDEETGIYYLNARYYDPKIARFLTEDTYRGQIYDPLSLNLYTYCYNEPIMYYDPSGHIVTDWDKEHLSKAEQDLVQKYSDKWTEYNEKANDPGLTQKEKEKALEKRDEQHDSAEEIRKKHRNENEIGRGDGHTVNKSTNEIVGKEKEKKDKADKEDKKSKSTNNTIPQINDSPSYPTTGSKLLDNFGGWIISVDDSLFGGKAYKVSEKIDQLRGIDSFSKSDWLRNPDFSKTYTAGSITNSIFGVISLGNGLKSLITSSGEIIVNSSGAIVDIIASNGTAVIQTAEGVRITYNSIDNVNRSSGYVGNEGGSKDNSMFGENGTQVISKTVWKEKGSQARIDVENPNPGQRPGQIHYQDANGKKYLFDPQKQVFVDKNGNVAPKSVNANLNNPDFVKKLNVGLEQYLGEPGIKLP
nr:RHS repeat-associated core domain-containing protein [Lutispora saccharofermentans]